ncbi:SDR family NAD(P)-dependent oxidoreductase [Chengkuizengella axinellae]|uniref:Glucose 1-dehydrogenase n=1 Tax=Chengkuizengella axinellae TaxID=3064388 RepID=A0ABT9IXV3_9BACL|nr:glucose 1-dehydrogenase [Chengkuizengella sp. 2205SS18-9]MDP5274191.1 glucose 1-dehydrogenase [Chengkuizengella sp. 2205SS18-9]
MLLKDKVVIIAGGSSGIGEAAAKRFIDEGAKVVINGRREGLLKETAKELDPRGENIAYVAGDISIKSTSEELVEKAVDTFGGVDVLVSNTGIFKPTGFLDHDEEDLNRYIDVILKGTFYSAQAAIPEMQKRGGGAIVNTGSMWAIQAVEATPSTAYSAAMAGRHALTKNLAVEFAKDNIRVNAVAPAVVETPIYNSFMTEEEVSKTLPTFNEFHPIGRNGQPGDVADAIVFLASEQSSWITGVVMPLDGGATSRLR